MGAEAPWSLAVEDGEPQEERDGSTQLRQQRHGDQNLRPRQDTRSSVKERRVDDHQSPHVVRFDLTSAAETTHSKVVTIVAKMRNAVIDALHAVRSGTNRAAQTTVSFTISHIGLSLGARGASAVYRH